MHKADLRRLQRTLIRGGVAPVFISRTLAELRDHCQDLEADALRAGCSVEEARSEARNRLGEHSVIAAEILRRPELKVWAFRWPWGPLVLRRFVVFVAISTVPAMAIVGRGSLIARWCISTGLAALLTGGLFLLMQRMISAGFPV